MRCFKNCRENRKADVPRNRTWAVSVTYYGGKVEYFPNLSESAATKLEAKYFNRDDVLIVSAAPEL